MSDKTLWGTDLGTGSASIDLVLIDAPNRLTGREILDEAARRGLPLRRDANPHLTTLKKRGYITNEDGYWFRVHNPPAHPMPNPKPTVVPIVSEQIPDDSAVEEESFVEGKELLRQHRILERNAKLIRRKKHRVLQTLGKLECEVCDFDFQTFYGELGEGFAECHHNRPLAELRVERVTRLSEMSIVCANCHRMLHRRPMQTVERLRKIVQSHRAHIDN